MDQRTDRPTDQRNNRPVDRQTSRPENYTGRLYVPFTHLLHVHVSQVGGVSRIRKWLRGVRACDAKLCAGHSASGSGGTALFLLGLSLWAAEVLRYSSSSSLPFPLVGLVVLRARAIS